MAQAKKKTATKTSKRPAARKAQSCRKGGSCCKKQQQKQAQRSNPFFLITMGTFALILFAIDLALIIA